MSKDRVTISIPRETYNNLLEIAKALKEEMGDDYSATKAISVIAHRHLKNMQKQVTVSK